MAKTLQEVQMFNNFDELANDLLNLATEIMPDKLIYLTSIVDKEQFILKLSKHDSEIQISEGMVFNLDDTVCNRIDFDAYQPLVLENIREEIGSDKLIELLKQVNINSYLGLPICHMDGGRFGTLCVAHHETSHFDEKNIQLLQRIVRMFSYYLELERYAYRDSLTSLYNRRYLAKLFENQSKVGGTLFFLDLDGFKKVNDRHGHDVGDQVLKEVAVRLRHFAAAYSDTFAIRLGGDEFMLHFSHTASTEEIAKRAEQLLSILNTWEEDYQLSASIGIVSYPENHTTDLDTLIKNADQALYQAKTAGKNTYQFFETLSH